jgi:hypothetical protein
MEGFGMIREETSPKIKKTYQEPVLRVYGDIQSLTGTAAATMHGNDGGTGKFSKT